MDANAFGQTYLYCSLFVRPMPEARLELTLPEDMWIGELTRQYSDATFEILAALPDKGDGVAMTEITSDRLDDLLEDMAAYDEVTSLDILNQTENRALVQFETTLPLLILAARDSGVPLELPFNLSNGRAVWELKASSDRLAMLSNQLEQFGISFTVDYVQYNVEDNPLLTPAQQEIIQKALEMGYYDTPRQCSLTDLAEEMDRAKSTVSETMHRAEEKIIKDFAESINTQKT